MGKVKSVFTMATLYLIRNLLNFSSRLLPVFIIIVALLKLSKVLIELSWYAVIAVLLLEVILVVGSLSFEAVFFKNKQNNKNTSNDKTSDDTQETNKGSEIAVKTNTFSVLNIAVAFFAFLGIIFVILKLFKAVTWNWVWVLSPLWLSTALVIFILLICLIIFIVSALNKNKSKKIESSNNTENASAENNNETANKSETYNEVNNLNQNNTDNTDNNK